MTEITDRPRPPEKLLEVDIEGRFAPAPDVLEWIRGVILDPAGELYNPDHAHLADASIGILWTTAVCRSKGRTVIGMAEIPAFRCNQWQRARQEQQLREWFGSVPDFVITFDAFYSDQARDIEFLALVEHELYHCSQAEDEFGEPRFNKETGLPIYSIKGHDVEEFVGVVRRYGVVSEAVKDLVIAAANKPEVAKINIARACGTCALKSA